MAYCRWSEGDCYVYGSGQGMTCCSCRIMPECDSYDLAGNCLGHTGLHEDYNTESKQEMLDHLLEHRKQGHQVPDSAITRLMREVQGGTVASSIPLREENEQSFEVDIGTCQNHVVIQFDEPLTSLALRPEQARKFADAILLQADMLEARLRKGH